MNSTPTQSGTHSKQLARRRALHLVLVALAAAGILAMGSALALDTSHAAQATPTNEPSPAPAGSAVHLSDADCALLGLPSNGMGQCLTDEPERYAVVAISASGADEDAPVHPGVQLLLDAGYTGEAGDQMEAIYAPLDLVLFDDETGTWAVTVDGLANCIHGVAQSCTYSSAPAVSPDGFALTVAYEDGSAVYGASRYSFDPDYFGAELGRFVLVA